MHLTETALLQFGPGSNCDQGKPSVKGRIVIEGYEKPRIRGGSKFVCEGPGDVCDYRYGVILVQNDM